MTITTPGRILSLNFWRLAIVLILGITAVILLSNIKPIIGTPATAVPIITPINLPIPPTRQGKNGNGGAREQQEVTQVLGIILKRVKVYILT